MVAPAYLLRSDATSGVYSQHTLNQILGTAHSTVHRGSRHATALSNTHALRGHVVPVRRIKVHVTLSDHLEQLGLIAVDEWWVTTQQDVRDDAQAPHVHQHVVRLAA